MNQSETNAYITRSNFEKIFSNINLEKQNKENYALLYGKDISFIFSTKEMDFLFSVMKSYEDANFLSGKYLKLERKEDTRSFVFEGGVPAYHFDKKCEKLKSNFINLEIPIEIKNSGKTEEFRKFCRANINILENDPGGFFKKLEIIFHLKNPPTQFGYNNSGREDVENMDLNELKEKIDQIIDGAHQFKNKDDYTLNLIKSKGYGTHIVPEAKEKGNPLNTWHVEYKKELKKFLIVYYRVKLNPELVFSGLLLEQIGFVPCNQCKPS
jgi:hypothetical protein